jgi:hypothetical protein
VSRLAGIAAALAALPILVVVLLLGAVGGTPAATATGTPTRSDLSRRAPARPRAVQDRGSRSSSGVAGSISSRLALGDPSFWQTAV